MSYVPPIITGNLQVPLPGPYAVGFGAVRHSPAHPYALDTPKVPEQSTSDLSSVPSEEGAQAGPGNGRAGGKGPIPAIAMRQVEYSIYYPCEKPSRGWFWQRGSRSPGSGVSWLPRPINVIIEGYSRFMNDHYLMKAAAPLLKASSGRLSLPFHPLAPLLPPTAQSHKPKLVIFSHGLAGTRTVYSGIAAALASEGDVVLAVAHADGSGPCVIVAGEEGQDEIKLGYLKNAELDWSPGTTPDVMKLRAMQLNLRRDEIYEVYNSFRSLVNNGQDTLKRLHLFTEDGPPQVPEVTDRNVTTEALSRGWLEKWKDAVEVDHLTLVGHSFGGGTLLHLLQTDPPKGFEEIPVRKAVALDPWVDPMPTPAPSARKSDKPSVPLLAINSERFTVWRTHFTRLRGLVTASGGNLVTLLGADHQSFSDFPLLITAPSASKLLVKMNSLIHNFLHDKLAESDEIRGKEPDHGNLKMIKDAKGKQKMEGAWGDVVVHELATN